MCPATHPASLNLLRTRVDVTSYQDATTRILDRAAAGGSGYVCAANVHMVMEAYDSPTFQRIVDGAFLVTADGMPLVWGLRAQGAGESRRVYGPTLVLHLCAEAARRGVPIALYGGTASSLEAFVRFLDRRSPGIQIACRIAPPFRPLTAAEESDVVGRITESGARIVLVGIGCPKQEQWMARLQDRVPAVMVGVGAAFDFHSGRVKQAPAWMQSIGMEWAFRLTQDPRRLWKRYLKHNPRFAALLALQLLKRWLDQHRRPAPLSTPLPSLEGEPR